jgi:hypothetical protein
MLGAAERPNKEDGGPIRWYYRHHPAVSLRSEIAEQPGVVQRL